MRYTLKNTTEIGILADVWLDGDPVMDAVEADTDEGFVVRAKRDAAGNIVLSGEYIEYERVEGDVRVETR